MAPLTN